MWKLPKFVGVAVALVALLASAARVSGARVPGSIQSKDTAVKLRRAEKDGRDGKSVVTAPGSLVEEIVSIMPDRMLTRISQEVEYHGLREQLLTLPMRRPRVFNAVLATSKTWLADLVVQIVENSKAATARCMGNRRDSARLHSRWWEFVDWHRSVAFAVFGLLYVGLFQWFTLVVIMSRFCPHAIEFSNQPFTDKLANHPGQLDLLKQVFIDNFIFAWLFYFPSFYIIKQAVRSGFTRKSVVDGLSNYRKNFFTDNLMNIVFWVPGDFVVFAAPMFLRLPIDHTISFAWTMMLSYVRGDSGNTQKGPSLQDPLEENPRRRESGNSVFQPAPPIPTTH